MSHTYRKFTPWDFKKEEATRDKKKWFKPTSTFKQCQKRKRKAKERQAFRDEKEVIPEFRRTDQWDWN